MAGKQDILGAWAVAAFLLSGGMAAARAPVAPAVPVVATPAPAVMPSPAVPPSTSTAPSPSTTAATSDDGGGRVVNGDPVEEGDARWMVELALKYDNKGKPDHWHMCGGVLIAPQWVLTATHCVSDKAGQLLADFTTNYVVRAGSVLRDGPGMRVFAIDKVIPHPDFKMIAAAGSPGGSRPMVNDVTLLRLKTPVPLSEKIMVRDKPVARFELALLPEADATLPDGEGEIKIYGWGAATTYSDADLRLLNAPTASSNARRDLTASKLAGQGAAVLQVAKLTVVDTDKCFKDYAFRDISSAPNVFCAWRLDPNAANKTADSCKGDSGGPLIVRERGRSVSVGVVSFSPMACGLYIPAANMRTASYVGWIRATVGDDAGLAR